MFTLHHTKRKRSALGYACRYTMLLVFAVSFFSFATVHAQNNDGWIQTNGPEGGDIASIAIDPLEETTVLVGTNGAGILRSEDRGATWTIVQTEPRIQSTVNTLLFNNGITDTLYAGTDGSGLYLSQDKGQTWQASSDALPDSTISGLAVVVSDPATILAATGSGMAKSNDGGSTWATSGLTDTMVTLLSSDSVGRFYAGTLRDGLYASDDGGSSWMTTGLTQTTPSALLVNPSDPMKLIAAVDGQGLLQSDDQGVTWTALGQGISVSRVNALAFGANTVDTIVAGTDDGVYISDNGGESWSRRSDGLTDSNVKSVAVASDETLYVGTDNGGLFRSDDAGLTWRTANAGLVNTFIRSLATEGQIYAGLEGLGIYRSDGESQWTPSNSGTEGLTVSALAVDDNQPAMLYAGSETSGIYQSEDNGITWSPAGSDLISTTIFSLATTPLNPAVVYAGTGGEGVYRSSDGGDSWARIGLANTQVTALAADPVVTDTLYATTMFNGFYRSNDGGESWTVASSGLTAGKSLMLPDTFLFAVDASANQPGLLYAGTGGGIYRSIDSGDNWENSGLSPHGVFAVAMDPSGGEGVYVGTDDGVYASGDGGATWINQWMPGVTFQALSVGSAKDNDASDLLYAGSLGQGVFERPVCEPLWRSASQGLLAPAAAVSSAIVREFAINPQDPQTLYAATDVNGVYKSLDGGATWNGGSITGTVSALALHPLDPDIIYAAMEDGGVVKSEDGAETWSTNSADSGQSALDENDVYDLAIDPIDPETLYAAAGPVYKSVDGGESWIEPTGTMTDIGSIAVAIDAVDPLVIYASSGISGVVKSEDGGVTWVEANNGLADTPLGLFGLSIMAHPILPNVVYVGTGSGIFLSLNGGSSWQSIGLDGIGVFSLAMDPFNTLRLRAGTYDGGVYYSDDGGTTWQRSGLINTAGVNALAYDPIDPTVVYAGTQGNGVLKLMSTCLK